jgi:hypothetical protein
MGVHGFISEIQMESDRRTRHEKNTRREGNIFGSQRRLKGMFRFGGIILSRMSQTLCYMNLGILPG